MVLMQEIVNPVDLSYQLVTSKGTTLMHILRSENDLPLARSGMRMIGQSVTAPFSQEKDYRSTLVCHQAMQQL